jgi:hypothetical protein
MSDYGLLQEVRISYRGSTLTAAAAVSDTELVVEYAGDFNYDPDDPDNSGGTLDLNGARLAYTAVTYGELPEDPDTIILAEPLTVAADVDDWVFAVAGGQILEDWEAYVTMDGGGDQVVARLSVDQRTQWPLGVYSDPVPVVLSDDLLHIEDAPGRTAGGRVAFRNIDTGTATGPGEDILIPLTFTPIDGSEQVFYNTTPLKRTDWSRDDFLLTIPGETWFRSGKGAWVDYAYDGAAAALDAVNAPGQVDAEYVSVSSVQSDHTSIPSPDDPAEGDVLVLVLSATNEVGCTDPRFEVKNVGTRPTWTGPLMGVWVGIDDGSGDPISVLMDSVAGSGGADSCGAVMRLRGNPLLPATDEAAPATASGASFSPTMPSLGSFGVAAIASEVGLVTSAITDDTLSNWTTRYRGQGAGGGHTSIYIGTAIGAPPAGTWTQAGDDPLYVAWIGGLQ